MKMQCKDHFDPVFHIKCVPPSRCRPLPYLIAQLANLLINFSPLGVTKKLLCHTASPLSFVFKSTCNFSHTFFFGLSCSSGVPAYPSTAMRSPGLAPAGMMIGSTSVWSALEEINKINHPPPLIESNPPLTLMCIGPFPWTQRPASLQASNCIALPPDDSASAQWAQSWPVH